MTVIDDVAAALVAQGLVQKTSEKLDWRIRRGFLTDAPDRSVCVYFAGGRPPEVVVQAGYPTVQIRVRGGPSDLAAVQTQEEAIFEFLHNCDAPNVLGIGYVYCFALQSGPLPLGQDERKRPALVRNYRIMAPR